MTTKKLLVVLLTVICTTAFAEANDSTFLKYLKVVPRLGSSSYKLIYQSQTEESLLVSIKDAKGDLLVRQRLSKTNGFILPVSLRNVESGSYRIEVKGKSGSLTETINHTTQSDYLMERLFLQKGKRGQFALVGHDLGNSEFNLLVYDDQSNQIYSDTLLSQVLLNKRYNLGNVPSEWVKILVYHRGDLLIESRIELK